MTDGQPVNVAEHVPRLRRVALRILGDAHEADEAVQEACLRAVRSSATFNGRAHISTWLHRIVTRCALDRIRKRKHESRTRALEEDVAMHGILAYVSEGPFRQAERKELFAIINVAVTALPDDCRDAFVLTQLDGYSYDEAARQQNVPRGTIASRVFRAKQTLVNKLGGIFDGEFNDG